LSPLQIIWLAGSQDPSPFFSSLVFFPHDTLARPGPLFFYPPVFFFPPPLPFLFPGHPSPPPPSEASRCCVEPQCHPQPGLCIFSNTPPFPLAAFTVCSPVRLPLVLGHAMLDSLERLIFFFPQPLYPLLSSMCQTVCFLVPI